MLKLAGAPGAFTHAGRLGLQPVPHQDGDFEDQPGMIGSQTQLLSFLVAEMRSQSHPDTVMDQRVRLAGQEPLGRSPEDEAQEGQRLRVTQHVTQPVAEMHR
jgi:hypothetical protein